MESAPWPLDRQRQTACLNMCTVWAWTAQRECGVDAQTARRLAFIRWLYVTGQRAIASPAQTSVG